MVSISLDALPNALPWLIEQIKLGNKVSIRDEAHEFAVVMPSEEKMNKSEALSEKQKMALEKAQKEGILRRGSERDKPWTLHKQNNLDNVNFDPEVLAKEADESFTYTGRFGTYEEEKALHRKQYIALRELAKRGLVRLGTGKLQPPTLHERINNPNINLSDEVIKERDETGTWQQ